MSRRRRVPEVTIRIPLEGRVEVWCTEGEDARERLTFDLLSDRRRYQIVSAAFEAQLWLTREERIECEDRIERIGQEHTILVGVHDEPDDEHEDSDDLEADEP